MRALPLLMLAWPTAAAELKVDHVTIAGRSVPAMQKLFEAAGIRTDFGGKHSNKQTEMAAASFPDGSYLELIGAQPGADAGPHYWGKFIDRGGGPCGWAISVASVEREAARLRAAGVTVTPTRSGRARPDGVTLRWVTATVGPQPQGSFFPFLIEDETPRDRRVYLDGKPSNTAFEGVAQVWIAVRDLDDAVAKWRKVFGLAEPVFSADAAMGARVAAFEGTPVVLAAPGNEASWLTARLRDFGEAPCAFVLRKKGGGKTVTWLDPAKLGGSWIGVR